MIRIVTTISDKASQIIPNAERVVLSVLREGAEYLRTLMSKSGDVIGYPVKWDSDKQRKAYFASNGFGRGIPYHRDGGYEQGWRVDSITNGYRTYNALPSARYVSGLPLGGSSPANGGQSRIHKIRWQSLQLAALMAIEFIKNKLPEELRNDTRLQK